MQMYLLMRRRISELVHFMLKVCWYLGQNGAPAEQHQSGPGLPPEWSTRHTSTRDTGISHVEWGSNHDIDLAVKICWQSITILISPDLNEKLMETSIPFIIHNQGNIKIFSSNYPTHPPLLSLSPSFLVPDVGLQWFLPEKTIYFYLTGLLFHINISFKLALGLAGAKIGILSHELWRLEKIFGFQLPLGLAGQKILILNQDSARTETNAPPSAPLCMMSVSDLRRL